MAEVRLENVTKIYGEQEAIRGVSFTCREGEFISILGPTGAGKTTILQLVAGIENISSGNIYFNGNIVNDLPPQKRNVSMTFETYNLYPFLSAYENIAFPLRAPRWNLDLSSQEERRKIEEIANFLGIKELLDKLPQNLSGGQKQRVALARTLVRNPEIYLLDEPIAHLDARLKFSTQTLLKEFAREERGTILYTTHDFKEALTLSDRILVLRKGVIEQKGTPKEVYSTPATDFVGRVVGDPPMNLIDGEIITRDDKTFFKAGEDFTIQVREDLVEGMKRVTSRENNQMVARLGIRCEHIELSKQRISDDSFQLPVYAVAHEEDSSVVTFELRDTFLNVRTEEHCDYNESEMVWLDFNQDHVFFYNKTITTSKA